MSNKKNTPKDYNDRFNEQEYNPNKTQERINVGDKEIIIRECSEEDLQDVKDYIKSVARWIGILLVAGSITMCSSEKKIDNAKCSSPIQIENGKPKMIDCRTAKLEKYILARCDACLDDCGEYNKNTCKDNKNK